MHHQHGPNCSHGHSHGHSHAHGSHQHMQGLGLQVAQESPEDYFKNLRKRWKDKQGRVFFWQEVLQGITLDRFYQRVGLDFMRSISCQPLIVIIHGLESLARFECIPDRLQPIIAGLFFPLLFLLFFNYNVNIGMDQTDDCLKIMIGATMVLYLLVAFRGNSSLNTDSIKSKSKQIFQIRPYLQNPQLNCPACGILRLFRAAHCPYCKSCIAKHSRHSVVFGYCIGAANQFLALCFFVSLGVTFSRIMWMFWSGNAYGLITKVMFYLLNFPLCWMSFNEALQFIVFNMWYGITEQELKMWTMQQYLQKLPERTFQNNVNQGITTNLINSLMAMLAIQGYQSQPEWAHNRNQYPKVDPNRTYRVNWDKAVTYIVPQIPFHKNRDTIMEMMQRDEPRMIEMFKLQSRFREEVMSEAGADQLNEFQLQQKIALKIQAHMTQNMPQMMQPSTQQMRTIQLQMLAHMKKQFATETDLLEKMVELQQRLKDNTLTPIEANMQMRMLQQGLMGRRMMKMKHQMDHQGSQLKEQQKLKEEEEAPMRSVADQDL